MRIYDHLFWVIQLTNNWLNDQAFSQHFSHVDRNSWQQVLTFSNGRMLFATATKFTACLHNAGNNNVRRALNVTVASNAAAWICLQWTCVWTWRGVFGFLLILCPVYSGKRGLKKKTMRRHCFSPFRFVLTAIFSLSEQIILNFVGGLRFLFSVWRGLSSLPSRNEWKKNSSSSRNFCCGHGSGWRWCDIPPLA